MSLCAYARGGEDCSWHGGFGFVHALLNEAVGSRREDVNTIARREDVNTIARVDVERHTNAGVRVDVDVRVVILCSV